MVQVVGAVTWIILEPPQQAEFTDVLIEFHERVQRILTRSLSMHEPPEFSCKHVPKNVNKRIRIQNLIRYFLNFQDQTF